MGEWSWVFVGYGAMVGALGAYAWWLRRRLVAARQRAESSG